VPTKIRKTREGEHVLFYKPRTNLALLVVVKKDQILEPRNTIQVREYIFIKRPKSFSGQRIPNTSVESSPTVYISEEVGIYRGGEEIYMALKDEKNSSFLPYYADWYKKRFLG